jgi:hypothetical protein
MYYIKVLKQRDHNSQKKSIGVTGNKQQTHIKRKISNSYIIIYLIIQNEREFITCKC